jgi:methionine synthase II (cobalamin-independent)
MPSPCLCRAKIYSSADEHAIGSKHAAVPRRPPLDQLCLSPQCGFASTAEGNLLTVEDQIAKLRLVVETAREVGG